MYAWVFTVYLCCSPQAINDSYVALFPLFYLCSFAVAAVALLAFAAFANRAPVSTMLEKASSWKAFCIGGAVCATIGTIWLAVAWTQGSLSLVEIVLIGCTTGFGQASLFLQWGSVLSSRAAVASIEDVCKAFLIASLIVCLQAMFPSILSMLLVALLPLVSAYILVTKLAPFTDCNGGQGERDEGGAYGEGLPNARETNELLLRTCMGALAIGLIMGALRYLAGDDIGFSGMYAVSKITASVICCLVVYFQSRRTRFEFSRIYRYIMLLMLTFVLTERDLISLEGWGVFSSTRSGADRKAEERPISSMDHARSAVATKSHEIANRYRLSEREEEVLTLLALGRSRSHIKSELFLSLGTVNTHVTHIYAKLGVHGKDELLAYFEEPIR